MNYVWSCLMILSFIFGAANGKISETLTAGLNGAKDSATVLLSFAGIMCFWSGILKICKESGAGEKLEKLLSPIVLRLFPKTKAIPQITLNIVSNLLGLGNAATPSGISAMTEMDAENQSSPRPSHEMCRFAIMNTSSLQLIPTTVIGILSASGAENPYKIIPYIWISSSLSLVLALALENITYRLERRREK